MIEQSHATLAIHSQEAQTTDSHHVKNPPQKQQLPSWRLGMNQRSARDKDTNTPPRRTESLEITVPDTASPENHPPLTKGNPTAQHTDQNDPKPRSRTRIKSRASFSPFPSIRPVLRAARAYAATNYETPRERCDFQDPAKHPPRAIISTETHKTPNPNPECAETRIPCRGERPRRKIVDRAHPAWWSASKEKKIEVPQQDTAISMISASSFWFATSEITHSHSRSQE